MAPILGRLRSSGPAGRPGSLVRAARQRAKVRSGAHPFNQPHRTSRRKGNDGHGDGSQAQQEGRPNPSHACRPMTAGFRGFAGLGGGARPCKGPKRPVIRRVVPQPVGIHPCPTGLVIGGDRD